MPEPAQSAAIPPQSITAAAIVLHDEGCGDGDTTKTCRRWNSKVPGYAQKHIGYYEDRAREVLEAAAPHLEAAAAERLAAWLEGPEAAAVTANTIRGQVDREIAEAVAAERERCAQLIEQQKELRSPSWFATLLREQP